MEANSDSAVISKYFIWFLTVVIVLLFIALYMQGRWCVQKGELADTDCYTRLNRVVQLHESGKWYDSNYPRSNVPFGENLHWTRPLDVLLLTGAWLASPLTDFKTGLFWWGVLISPFLLAASLMILPWTFRPMLSDDSNLTSLLFIFQFGAMAAYSIGRPDHHSLLGLIFIINIGLILRLILGSLNKTLCFIAGMASAFSLWIHVESLLLIFLSFLLLGLFWIFDDDNDDFIRKNVYYSIALFVFTGAALILEYPWYNLKSIEYDEVSLVHWFIFGLVSLFWIVVFSLRRHHVFPEQGRTWRFIISSLGAATVALCLWLFFPAFYRGGYADIDPRIVPIWLNKVVEVQPPLSRDFLIPLIQLLSSAVMGILYIIFILWKEPDKNLKGWIFILSGILLFASAGIFERRLLLYGNIVTLAPLAAILGRMLRWEVNHVKLLFRVFILPVTIISFCVVFLLPGIICGKIVEKNDESRQKEKVVPLSQLCDALNKLDAGQARKIRILAFIDYGPQILYRTRYEIIGTPYHRNAQGILDTYKIMTAKSDDEAHELIRKRKIDMILVSNASNERNFYSAAPQQSTFYNRLQVDGYPDWLKAIKLSPNLFTSYRLFRVMR